MWAIQILVPLEDRTIYFSHIENNNRLFLLIVYLHPVYFCYVYLQKFYSVNERTNDTITVLQLTVIPLMRHHPHI